MALAGEDDPGRAERSPIDPQLAPVRVERAERALAEREQALAVLRPGELGRHARRDPSARSSSSSPRRRARSGRRPSRRRAGGSDPGLHAGGVVPTTLRSGPSPGPVAARRRAARARSGTRSGSTRPGLERPARAAQDPVSRERPPDRPVGRQRGQPVGSRHRDVLRVRRPGALHHGPSFRIEPSAWTIHGPGAGVDESWPRAGSAVRTGFGARGLVARDRVVNVSRRARAPATRAAPRAARRAPPRPAARAGGCAAARRAARARRRTTRTIDQARRSASSSSGAWIRCSARRRSSLTAAPCRESPRGGRGPRRRPGVDRPARKVEQVGDLRRACTRAGSAGRSRRAAPARSDASPAATPSENVPRSPVSKSCRAWASEISRRSDLARAQSIARLTTATTKSSSWAPCGLAGRPSATRRCWRRWR